MRIACPNCSSSFEIPAELLGKKGRTLKCASCTHSWYQGTRPDQRPSQQGGLGVIKPNTANARVGPTSGQSLRAASDSAARGQSAISWMHPERAQAGPRARSDISNKHPTVQAAPLKKKGASRAPQSPTPLPTGAVSVMTRLQRGPQERPSQHGGALDAATKPRVTTSRTTGPASGQSLRGAAGGAARGQSAISWMHPEGAQGGRPVVPGQSISGRDVNLAPGEDSISWMDNGQGEPGAPGESLMGASASGDSEQNPHLKGVRGESTDGDSGGRGKFDPKLVEGERRNRKSDLEWVSGGDSGSVLPEMGGLPRTTDKGLASDVLEDDAGMLAQDADQADSSPEDDNTENAKADSEDSDAAAKDRKDANRRERNKRQKPIDPAYISAAFIGAAILSLALIVWFGREALIDTFPGFAEFYDSIGMSSESMGSGLSILETGKRLMRVGGVEALVVRGFVSNVSDLQRPVPGLRLELFNQADEVIQDAVASTSMEQLSPGGTVEFELRMELPQLDSAQGYRVVWDTND